MFGISWTEFALTAVVAIIVIGPKELPHLLYSAGKFFRKIKKFSSDVQSSLDEIMHEGELEQIIQDANKPGGENLQFEIERQLSLEEKNQKTGTDG